MKKKFNIRIRHYYENQYVIEYSHGYFFKIWIQLRQYIKTFSCYDPLLFRYDEAKKFASKFKTISDIRLFQTEQLKLEENDKFNKSNLYKREVPVKIENIL